MSRVPSTDLFDLIKSLSKAEKRQFKLYTARRGNSGKSKYLMLFEALDRMERYDEEKLLQQNPMLRGSDLKSIKPYLYELIIQSLRTTLKDRSPAAEMRYQLDKGMILIERGLYGQASHLLEKVKEKGEKEEYFTMLIDILELEDYLRVREEGNNRPEYHQMLTEQAEETIAKLLTSSHYRSLSVQMFYIFNNQAFANSTESLQQLNHFMEDTLLAEERNATTFIARIKFYEIHFFNQWLRNDMVRAIEYARLQVELFQEETRMVERYLYTYAFALGNLLIVSQILDYEDEFEQTLTRLKELEGKYRGHPDWIDIALNRRYIEYLHTDSIGRYDQTPAAIEEFNLFLQEYGNRIQKSILLTFYVEFARSCTILGDFTNSLYWTSLVANDPDSGKYGRLVESIKWMNVVNHVELGNVQAAESALRSAYRYLRKKKFLHGADQLILSFIKSLSGLLTESARREGFRKLLEELEELGEEALDGKIRFDMVKWLQSKIEKKSFVQFRLA